MKKGETKPLENEKNIDKKGDKKIFIKDFRVRG